MNRREAIKLLTAVPGLATVKRADLQPGDVLVAEVTGHITQEQVEYLRTAFREVFPRNRVVVLADGISLRVIRDLPPGVAP